MMVDTCIQVGTQEKVLFCVDVVKEETKGVKEVLLGPQEGPGEPLANGRPFNGGCNCAGAA